MTERCYSRVRFNIVRKPVILKCSKFAPWISQLSQVLSHERIKFVDHLELLG
jgi:hypothetical protein